VSSSSYSPLTASEPPSLLSTRHFFHKIAKDFAFLRNPKFSSPPVAGLPRDRVWRGLARYWDPEEEEAQRKPRREEREYAKATTLVETPRLELKYYSDDPGKSSKIGLARWLTSQVQYPTPTVQSSSILQMNWAMSSLLRNTVSRSRSMAVSSNMAHGRIVSGKYNRDDIAHLSDALQTAFAPSIFFDSEPRARLHPGDQRVHTHMLINVNLAQETTLRVPTREPSKVSRTLIAQLIFRIGLMTVPTCQPRNVAMVGSISLSDLIHP
jgi:hypothetical protein